MQIVIYNPHIDDFFYKPLIYKFLNRRPLKKYGFFTKSKNLSVYIDNTESGIIPFSIFNRLPNFFRKFILKIEIHFWSKLNNDCQINILKNPTSNHVLIMMSYKLANNMTKERVKNLNKFKYVVAHLSHYFINTKKKSLNLSKLNNLFLAGDSNILKNKYFKTFFSWYDKSFIVLPFAVSKRWEKRIPFKDRKKYLIASGTVHDLKNEKPKYLYEDFINISGLNYYHPTRIEADEICKKFGYTSYVNQYRGNKSNWVSLIFNRLRISQKKYFSIDLTDQYNKHKFAIVGEEWSGFPALGAFEAIACGAVLICDSDKYIDTGLVKDLHYISTNKNLTNTVEKIKLLPDSLLKKISNQGSNFVKTKFNSNSVMLTWLNNLQKISKHIDEENFSH